MRKNRESGSAPLFVVMMAGALGVLIGYALVKMTTATGLFAKSAQLEQDIDKLVREINGTLANAKACPGAFRDGSDALVVANPAATPITVNRFYAGYSAGTRPIARLNATTAGLVISTMKLDYPVKIQGNTWEMTFELLLEKKLDASTYLPGAATILKRFRVAVTLDGSNNIVACSPLGSRMSLGPMSPLRASINMTAAVCTDDTEKDGLCAALTPPALTGLPPFPQTYFAANQGDVLAFQMLRSTTTVVAPGGAVPGFGLYGVGIRLYARGGGHGLWALMDDATVDGPCQAMCINKDAKLRFTRGGVASNSAIGVKDNLCKAEFGPHYLAATLNDFAQAGWSTTTAGGLGGGVGIYNATVAGHSGDVQFGSTGPGNTLLINVTGSNNVRPVGCVRSR